MNKTLKWILIGLGIVLVVGLIAVSIFFVARNGSALAQSYPYGMPMLRRRFGMHYGGGFYFGRFRIIGGLFGLGILALLVWGIVALARHNRTPMTPPPMPPANTIQNNQSTTPAQPAQPTQSVPPVNQARVCSNCGKPLPAEAEYCPFCGAKQ
mgnify:CR=1 FL=1